MNVIDILKKYKVEQDAERIRIGDKWVETDRLFVKWNGSPMNPQTPYGWLKEFCEEHDFPFYGVHQFRHLHTSLLIGAGIDPTTVSGVLGHAQVSTTVNTPKGHIPNPAAIFDIATKVQRPIKAAEPYVFFSIFKDLV